MAFFIGMLTGVPALYSFCLVAGLGVLADFLLQITVFIAALTLDTKRIQANRLDVVPFIKLERKREPRRAFVREAFSKYFVPVMFKIQTEICVYVTAVIFFALGVTACF